MTNCTEFCEKIHSLSLSNGVLPSHDAIVAHFDPNNACPELEWPLGTWQAIQSRITCSFCQIVVVAVEQDANSQNHSYVISQDRPIGVVLFPGETGFRLTYPSRLGTCIALVADAREHVSSPDNARILDIKPSDFQRLKHWIKACDEGHPECSGDAKLSVQKFSYKTDQEDLESKSPSFRVLDLVEDRIKPVALDTRYLTLSYVWGQTPTVLLQRDNQAALTSPGGLAKIRDRLPRTINDAIDLARTLGERYLWIDALCLLQDDAYDVELGVSAMQSIFRGSYLTIVAASGSDGNAGLPRLRSVDSQHAQVVKELRSGIRVTIVRSIDWHLARSTYNQRGWTLQELVMPPRSAIFIEDRIYFRCQQANWSEETWSDQWSDWLDADDSNISRIPDWTDGQESCSWAYQKLCEQYSTRVLRNDGDAIRAMAGIMRQIFAGMGTPGVEGLPGYFLDFFLLFYSSNADLRRRPEFASFSWAGWEGRVMWPRENYTRYDEGVEDWNPSNMFKWLSDSRLVEWSTLTLDAKLKYLSSFRNQGRAPIDDFGMVFPGVTLGSREADLGNSEATMYSKRIQSLQHPPEWGRGGVEFAYENATRLIDAAEDSADYDLILGSVKDTRAKFTLLNYITVRRLRDRKVQRRTRGVSGASSKVRGSNSLAGSPYQFRPSRLPRTSPEEMSRISNDARAKTRIAKMREVNPDLTDEEILRLPIPKFPPYDVLHVRTISLHLNLGILPSYENHWNMQRDSSPTSFDRGPALPLVDRMGDIAGWLHPDNIKLMGDPGSGIELIVLSRGQTPTISPQSEFTSNYKISNTPKAGAWTLLWVLYIVWLDGIAERRGVGQIFESSLQVAVEPLPILKSILLG